jgi:hypothetical protein
MDTGQSDLSLPQLEAMLKTLDSSIASLIEHRHIIANLVNIRRTERQLAEMDGKKE